MRTLPPLLLGLLLAAPTCPVSSQSPPGEGSSAATPQPAGLAFGTLCGSQPPSTALTWNCQGLAASLREGTLRLEIAPKGRGTATAALAPLEPLRLYQIALVGRRGPGTGLSVAVNYSDAAGTAASRSIVFQLRSGPRPNYWPLAPFRQEYVQQFCLPPGARRAVLQLGLTGHAEAGFNFFELAGLAITAGATVPLGEHYGPNLLPGGDLPPAGGRGVLPPAWGTWGQAPETMEIVARDAADPAPPGGKGILRIGPGKSFILAAPDVPIEPGRAYRVSFWVRGKADLGIGVHALENIRPYPLRVGDPQVRSFHVESATWTRCECVWFAESLYAAAGQMFISISPRAETCLADLALQRIGP